MTDRELLELAAKAAGVELNGAWAESPYLFAYYWRSPGVPVAWNPLADDGDALRLAAHLRIQIQPGKHKGDGCSASSRLDGIVGHTVFRDDPSEQMRMAIVKVAAEIGRMTK